MEKEAEAKVDEVAEQLEKLKISNGDKKIASLDFNGVVEMLKSGQYKNIIVMCGAGISTAAGIPDFRSPDTGFYAKMAKKYGMKNPETLFSIEYFKKDPKIYYKRGANLFADEYMPTFVHYFISLLNKKELLLRCYTQNIDTLERRAGIPGDKLVEAHGSVHSNHCIACKAEYSPEWFKKIVLKKKIGYCEKCDGGIVKPDVVFFGEDLPDRFFDLKDEDFPKCDLLLVMGTSLKVQPFSGLINMVKSDVPRVLINMEAVGEQVHKMGDFFSMAKGFDFNGPENRRDIALLGDLQKTVKELVSAVGWEKDLAELQADVAGKWKASKSEKKDKHKKEKK